jgi:hypothetical protein
MVVSISVKGVSHTMFVNNTSQLAALCRNMVFNEYEVEILKPPDDTLIYNFAAGGKDYRFMFTDEGEVITKN